MQRVTINGRWPLWVADHQAPLWTRPGGWETARLDAMAKVIGPGSVVYYVGAEEGDQPALLASWGARMVLIEPGERVWANIRAVWDANQLPTPELCFHGFAYDMNRLNEAVIQIGRWPDSSNGPVVDDHGFRTFVERPEIDAIRLDDLATGTGLIPTDISIDVEGAEWRVLAGAEQLMREHRPRLWVSVHPTFMHAMLGEDATEMHKWIRGLGYGFRLIDWQHELHVLYAPEESA